jgi:hypothetical protein
MSMIGAHLGPSTALGRALQHLSGDLVVVRHLLSLRG